MSIDFDTMEVAPIPQFKGGEKELKAQMFFDGTNRIMHGMLNRCYLEITNSCNLHCTFCPKTKRAHRRLTADEFETLTDRLQGHIRFLYFHLMGEPLLHPLLPSFIGRARQKGFVPIVTTNGTRLQGQRDIIEAHPYKINISLHSQEGNGLVAAHESVAARQDGVPAYMAQVMTFAAEAAQQGIIVILRLWNQGGLESQNAHILSEARTFVPEPWQSRPDGYRLRENLYIEFDTAFVWPKEELETDEQEEAPSEEHSAFCYALRSQLGVLVDGTVVPCCLDHEGSIPLGNLFQQPLEEILHSPRALALYEGFSRHIAVEPLCRTCGFTQSRLQKAQHRTLLNK